MSIATLIHDFLGKAGQQDLIRRYQLEPFSIPVLCVERTLCEKIMGLIRAGHEEDSSAEFRRRIRHFYDIVMIMRVAKYREFVDSGTFAAMIAEVGAWDRRSMPGASAWLDPPLEDALIVADVDTVWSKTRSEFQGSFKDMVYGDSVPEDDEVLACFGSISVALSKV